MRAQLRQARRSLGAGTTQPSDCTSNLGSLPVRGARALAGHPEGPLAITHPTSKRKNSSGTGRRLDSIWLTGHWTVQHISHLYDDGIAAGSDRALVVTDLATA
jgi:hypothetical protein